MTGSPWKRARLLKGLNLNHRQIVEAALIRAEAIGRTELHPEIAMKHQSELPTVVASHGFNMRQTSFLALHLRSPFPRLRKNQRQNFRRVPTNPASLGFTKRAPLPAVLASWRCYRRSSANTNRSFTICQRRSGKLRTETSYLPESRFLL